MPTPRNPITILIVITRRPFDFAALEVLGVLYDAHAAVPELLEDAVVKDGLTDHWRESYACETGKSIKA